MHDLQINADVLSRVEQMLPALERASKTAGRRDTQFVAKHINCLMLGRTPFSIMRQCLSKIERTKDALIDAKFKLAKAKIRAAILKEAAAKASGNERELLEVKAAEKLSGVERSELYINGALKNIANYMSIYEQVRVSAGIPKDWDELDYERAEAEHHLQQAFLQALRDVVVSRNISPANQEYLEHVGIGAFAALVEIRAAVDRFGRMCAENRPPLMADVDEWLRAMAKKYESVPSDYIISHGIEPVDEWYVFKDRNS